MNFASKLNQTGVYWAPTSQATGDGNRIYSAPVELTGRVRFVNKRVQFTNTQGKTEISNAIVNIDGDDIELLLGGKYFNGTLDDLTPAEEADPNTVRLAYEIKRNELIPGVSAVQSLREVIL